MWLQISPCEQDLTRFGTVVLFHKKQTENPTDTQGLEDTLRYLGIPSPQLLFPFINSFFFFFLLLSAISLKSFVYSRALLEVI